MSDSFYMQALRIPRSDFEIRTDAVVLAPGKKLVIEAPSGFGKTTLLRALVGFEQVNGEFGFLDSTGSSHPLNKIPVQERKLGVLFQDQLLLSHLNAIENVALGLRLKGISKREALNAAEAELKLANLGSRCHASITKLSGGERQRVALLRALIIEPKLLILDEPYKGLDAESHAHIQIYLQAKLDARPIPVIIISHQDENSDIRLVGEKMHVQSSPHLIRHFRLVSSPVI